LRHALVARHLLALGDTADLLRAVQRRDLLFFHWALDIAIDHFLQALFAQNGAYFPSRKRSLECLKGFAQKPSRCGERLTECIRLGASEETLGLSLAIWQSLVEALKSQSP